MRDLEGGGDSENEDHAALVEQQKILLNDILEQNFADMSPDANDGVQNMNQMNNALNASISTNEARQKNIKKRKLN